MQLLSALFGWNLLVDDLATVRAVANLWIGTLMIGIEAATFIRYHILFPSLLQPETHFRSQATQSRTAVSSKGLLMNVAFPFRSVAFLLRNGVPS